MKIIGKLKRGGHLMGVVATGLVLTTGLALNVARAGATTMPVWQVSTGFAPTNLPPAKNEVQKITDTATEGEFILYTEENGGFQIAGFLAYDATAVEVREALENVYGAGNVEVTGGPGGEAPFTVTTVKERAGGPVTELHALDFGDPEAVSSKVVTEGGSGQIVIVATNLGDASASGASPNSPVSVTDKLPPGLEATAISGYAGYNGALGTMNCPAVSTPALVSCEYDGSLPPYEFMEVTIDVKATGTVASDNEVTVTGGGAKTASSTQPVTVSSEPTQFGVEDYEMAPRNEDGSLDTLAGSHPFALTMTIALNKVLRGGLQAPAGLTQNLRFHLPAGLVADVSAVPQCTVSEFDEDKASGVNGCPASTAIGVSNATVVIPDLSSSPITLTVPLFNLNPGVGEPARFGFDFYGVRVLVNTSVRTGGDYGVTVSVSNISEAGGFIRNQVTFWGVPGNPSHDQSRGWGCVASGFFVGIEGTGACTAQAQQHPLPLLTLPVSCAQAYETSVESESWAAPDSPSIRATPISDVLPEAFTGCNRVPFGAEIEAAPDIEAASMPTGMTVRVHVPQEAGQNPNGVGDSDIKEIEVELPQGVTLNPGGAGGLQACSAEQIGVKGPNPEALGGLEFTPSAPTCPKQSKIATAVIHTPLLPNPLEGAVYLATPDPLGTAELGDNPFNSLIAMYLVAEDPSSGTLVKLPMHVELNEATGQVTTTVDNPQLPFEDAELHFFGGGRAPLATPGLCGSYTTKAVFTPWSGNAPVESTSTFSITSGPNGSRCPSNPKPFTPEFNTGTVNNQAGGYSELRMTMGHPDVDQALGALHMVLPPGVMGSLSHVKLCGEPQAAEGTCGPESLIGHTTVTAGLGSTPAIVARPGNVYITGPYKGAPYGLSIANPAETGPFDLEKGTKCDCIVVRAKVEVDPHTAQLIITSDPLPTMLRGIPLDLQHVSVQVNRPDFTFNPTNCDPMKIEGTLSGAEGAVSPISEPFQVANCAALAFKPGFTASTGAKHTKADGASLKVVVTSGPGQANIREVHVELPRQLPSRLATLQKACLVAVFDADPASCPAASIVGTAVAHTPVLPVPLKGPAYFVSHGGAKFPELIIVLQGYGVTVDLAGETFISKAGVTSSTFKSVPDVPVTRFELTLPTGPHSALGATANLCKAGKTVTVTKSVRRKVRGHWKYVKVKVRKKRRALAMPTTMIGQNGAEVRENTIVGVSGCAKAHKPKKSSTMRGSHKHKKKHRR